MSLTQDLLKEMFDYRDGCLINRYTRGPRAVAGSVAGGKNSSTGYWRIGINGKSYQLSRLIWIWHHGDIDDTKVMDHINGDIDDNQIENLRLCTHMENEWNKAVIGVRFEKGKWRARYKHNKKSHHIGMYDTKEEATAAYLDAINKVRKEYSTRKAA